MKRTNRVLLCLLACTALTSCSTPYKAYSGDSVAYIRFVDDMNLNLAGKRVSAVTFYDQPECLNETMIATSEWVAVPANRKLTFHQFRDTRGAGLVQGYCGVWGGLVLREGQRAEVLYSFKPVGLQWNCSLQATEIAANGERLQRLALAPACGTHQ